MLEKSSEATLPIHLSKSAPDNHAVSSSSPVRQEMIQSIKSLDDMLISSYRASLSHHSYACLSHSKKTDVETGVDVIFFGEAENAQLGIEDVYLSEIAIDQDKTQSHKKEKIISNEWDAISKKEQHTLYLCTNFTTKRKKFLMTNSRTRTMVIFPGVLSSKLSKEIAVMFSSNREHHSLPLDQAKWNLPVAGVKRFLVTSIKHLQMTTKPMSIQN